MSFFKKIFFILIFSTTIIHANNLTIAITKIMSHPSLNLIEEGIVDTLKQEYPDTRFIINTAQGNITIAAQIAQKFASLQPDIVVPITTPSAQTIVKNFRGSPTPIVFAAVTDPIGANLLKSLELPTEKLTGVVDQPPISDTLRLIKHINPQVKKIGVIYNAGESNSEFQIAMLRKEADKKNIEIVEVPVAKSSDIQLATNSIIEKVDCFFLPNDNLVISAIESILKIANAKNKLVYVSDPESVRRGAFAAFAFDQYQIGKTVGELAIKILKKEKGTPLPPPHLMNNSRLYINEKMAAEKGLTDKIKVFL